MVGSEQALYLIDGSSYIYRAFYAVKDLSTSRGLPTNAVYGFLGMLRRVLKEKSPTYLAVALDAPGPTFRHQLSAEYKATRPQMPEPLARQLPYIKRLIALYGIPLLEVNGVEADDIIGTLTAWAAGQGRQVVIVSGDKDLLQLVSPRVCLWDTMKDVVVGPQDVERRYGVPPSQLVEVMGLAGDSSDNIPGVPGIGPKTAERLIREFGSIENLLANLARVPSAKERSKLEVYAAQARLSRELVTLNCQVSLEPDWEGLRIGTADREALVALFRELEFRKFLQELEGDGAITEGSRGQIDAGLITTAGELGALVTRLAGVPEIGVTVISAFTLGVEAGLPAEAMVLEMYMSGEMSRTFQAFAEVGFMESVGWHGAVAQYGGFIRTLEVDREGMHRMFGGVLEDIRSGGFARRFQEEHAAGYPTVAAINAVKASGSLMTDAERRVREALGG